MANEDPQAAQPPASSGNITVGNIQNAVGVAVGHHASAYGQQGVSGDVLSQLFEDVYKRIESRPEDPNIDRPEIAQKVQQIQAEAAKDEEQANPSKIERWLGDLANMAPDILDLAVNALINPAVVVPGAIRLIAARFKRS